MILRRLFMLLFLLTQISVAAAAPVSAGVADAAPAAGHCADSEADSADLHAAGDEHVQCDDGCQQCAACVPGLAAAAVGDHNQSVSLSALFSPVAEPSGTLTNLLRPPQ